MARQSTRKKPAGKFPLTLHRTGQWCKKVRGKLLYFGKDEEAALNRWLDEKDELLAGRKPREQRDGLSLVDAVNRFLTAKQNQVSTGELTERSWQDYKRTCAKLLDCFGRNRLVDDLQPDDFEKLRAAFGKTRGAVGIGNEVTRTRVLFKYCYDSQLIDRPVRFGPTFKRASRMV